MLSASPGTRRRWLGVLFWLLLLGGSGRRRQLHVPAFWSAQVGNGALAPPLDVGSHLPCVLKPLKALSEVTVADMLAPCLLTPPDRLPLYSGSGGYAAVPKSQLQQFLDAGRACLLVASALQHCASNFQRNRTIATCEQCAGERRAAIAAFREDSCRPRKQAPPERAGLAEPSAKCIAISAYISEPHSSRRARSIQHSASPQLSQCLRARHQSVRHIRGHVVLPGPGRSAGQRQQQ